MVRMDPLHPVLPAVEGPAGGLLAAVPAAVRRYDHRTGLLWILPTGLDLRPYYVPGTDLFARAVRMLYRTDTATNVCPSIHVFNSVTLMLAYHRCRLFEEPRRRWMRPAADVLCFSIVCSTMLLKQHSCIDVVLGALLALVLDALFNRAAERSEQPQIWHA